MRGDEEMMLRYANRMLRMEPLVKRSCRKSQENVYGSVEEKSEGEVGVTKRQRRDGQGRSDAGTSNRKRRNTSETMLYAGVCVCV